MTLPRAARSGLLLGGLCLVGGAPAAVAIAAPGGHRSRDRPSHAVRTCHRRARHHHCPAARDGKQSHRKPSNRKRTRGSVSKPPAPGRATNGSGSPGASGAPWTAAPAPVIPGSTTPGSGGTPPGSAGGPPVATLPTAPAGPEQVQVTAEDTEGFHFILSRPSVAAGPVIIEFVNHGQDEHNLHAVEPTEGAEAGSLPNTAPKGHPTLKLNLHAGSYTLFCSLPGHEAKGMKAVLKVE